MPDELWFRFTFKISRFGPDKTRKFENVIIRSCSFCDMTNVMGVDYSLFYLLSLLYDISLFDSSRSKQIDSLLMARRRGSIWRTIKVALLTWYC